MDEVIKESRLKLKCEKIRDDLYVRKSIFGYSMVYPLKNEDGTWNRKNIFWFIVKFLGIVGLGILSLWTWKYDNSTCLEIVRNGQSCIQSLNYKLPSVPQLNITLGG